MQSPPRYTPCNGLMQETDFGNYVSYQDYLILKSSIEEFEKNQKRICALLKEQIKESDDQLLKVECLIRTLARDLSIKITSVNALPGLTWNQFQDGCLSLFKENKDLKWAWNNDTSLIKSLAKSLGIEITASDTDTTLQWEQFSQGCSKLKTIGELRRDRADGLVDELNKLQEAHKKGYKNLCSLAKDLGIEITAPECKPNFAWEEFVKGCLFKKNIELNYFTPDIKSEPDFQTKLKNIINYHSKENGSNIPDFILAQFLSDSLEAWNKNVSRREEWYGRRPNSIKIPE